jgi:hypothetical protein
MEFLLSLIIDPAQRELVRTKILTERQEYDSRWADEVRRCERLAASMPDLGAGILYRDDR